MNMIRIVCEKKKAGYRTSLMLCTLFLSFFIYSSVHAGSDIKEGYDENTELRVKGKIAEIMPWKKGPLVLKLLATGNKTYALITAPPWYLNQQNISFSPGIEIEVIGSKYIDSDGAPYIIGSQIIFPATGNILPLRDAACRPIWGKHKGRNRFP